MFESAAVWEPLRGEKTSDYRLASITEKRNTLNDCNEFYIIMQHIKDSEKKIQILFKHSTDIYKVTKKELDVSTIASLKKEWGDALDSEQMFFKTNDSSYLQWMTDQSYGVRDNLSHMHFSFVTSDWIVDVIESDEPQISIIYTSIELGD